MEESVPNFVENFFQQWIISNHMAKKNILLLFNRNCHNNGSYALQPMFSMFHGKLLLFRLLWNQSLIFRFIVIRKLLKKILKTGLSTIVQQFFHIEE